jgi:hypothetical protein
MFRWLGFFAASMVPPGVNGDSYERLNIANRRRITDQPLADTIWRSWFAIAARERLTMIAISTTQTIPSTT